MQTFFFFWLRDAAISRMLFCMLWFRSLLGHIWKPGQAAPGNYLYFSASVLLQWLCVRCDFVFCTHQEQFYYHNMLFVSFNEEPVLHFFIEQLYCLTLAGDFAGNPPFFSSLAGFMLATSFGLQKKQYVLRCYIQVMEIWGTIFLWGTKSPPFFSR